MNKPSPATPPDGGGQPAWETRGWTVLLLVLGLALAWTLRHVLLLGFAAVLLALALHALSSCLGRCGRLRPRMALACTVLGLLLVLGLTIAWVGEPIASQLATLGETLPKALVALSSWLEERNWGRWLLQMAQAYELGPQEMSRLARLAGGTVNAGIEALGASVLLVALGLYIAADPELYQRGFVRLFPVAHRQQVSETLRCCGDRLLRWLLGQGVTMLLVAVLTWAGLALIGMRLAPTLGIIAGLLEFVPYVGTLAASLLILVLALTQGEAMVVYAALVCALVQLTEAYLIQPMAQRWAVRLPPVLSLLAVLVYSVLFQLPGLLLAVPMMVLTMTLVQVLWIGPRDEALLRSAVPLERRPSAFDEAAVAIDSAGASSGSTSNRPLEQG